ncbi:MAG TPA: cytochrome c [Vicinamibacterales bacterium]|nr:cytochrome c [Vicinamibacterales bacterium]
MTFAAAVSIGVVALGVSASVSLRAQQAPRPGSGQARTAKDGVYTAAQAARGSAIFQMRCAVCHGDRLEGLAGPPLVGDVFLGPRDKQPVSDLFDKIHNTMPADAPGTLEPPQVADLVAFILQANTFPAGGAELGAADAMLKQIALVAANPAPATAAAGTATAFPVTGTLNQVMRGILFPSSNVLFDVQTKDPGAGSKGGVARADASTTSSRYGDVYAPWMVVDAAAISIAEIGPVLMQPGRRCENGKPVPVDRADWQEYVQGVVDAGRAAYRASQTRSQNAVSDATNVISDACANCHRVYRDVPSAAQRCTPPR